MLAVRIKGREEDAQIGSDFIHKEIKFGRESTKLACCQ